eukprot:CAMPEP_0171836346 /NCGR_PEP_ID=MMETSP0992-20121227/11518_1 /TAXON_ID=483369 /ORGANISM="non described non described, Strain CCMP2098" /LENGTH=50 /DNA_ID=CAMNT_0012452331 /DNA_START=620 /DNA_END=772 /DNA_ORIENTATION=+
MRNICGPKAWVYFPLPPPRPPPPHYDLDNVSNNEANFGLKAPVLKAQGGL